MRRPPRDLNERSNSLFAGTISAVAALTGLLLLVGRNQGPSFYVMVSLLSMPSWAALFILAGVAGGAGQVLRSWQLIVAGHAVGCVVSAVVAGCFYVASGLPEGQASLHPAGPYLGMSVLHLLAAMVSRPPR